MTATTNEETLTADAARARLTTQRWIQLVIGIVCMVMIANYQYGWTNFVTPITKELKLTREAVQWTFTLFVAAETWLVPVEGYLVDRFSPRSVVLFGGVIAALGWVINSYAGSMGMLVFGQVVAGIGAGAVYGTCVGNALKWFPERRGLAAGLTAAGFGAGSALTVSPIVSSIATDGYQSTFLTYGIGQGVVIFVLAWFLRKPDAKIVAALPKPAKVSNRPQYTWRQVLKSPPFWVMYLMFVLMATGGLFLTANLAPMGEDWAIAKVPVTLFGLSYTAVVFAQKIDRVLNGITRPFFGWVSDKIGRENTMLIAFGAEAIGIFLLSRFGTDPVMFVILTGTVYFAWGEIYSLFPSTCADTYGWKYATTNAGMLYTAKGTGALLVPFCTALAGRGNWQTALALVAVMNLAAAILAIAVLKPMRRKVMIADEAAAKPVSEVAAAAAQPARSKVPQASQPLAKAAPLDAPALAPSPAKEAQDGEPAPETKAATDAPPAQRPV